MKMTEPTRNAKPREARARIRVATRRVGGKKLSAAEYIQQHDGEMRVILGELLEYAARINIWWTFAQDQAREHPEAALKNLIDAEIHLDNHVRLELSDSLRVIRAATNRLAAELPDDGDEEASDSL